MKESNGAWRITFDTNPDDCNLSCIMCEDHSPFSSTQKDRIHAGRARRRMPMALIRKIVAENKPFGLREIIPSTMGEPLLYKQFPEILALCTEYDIKLNLTTNGTFPIKGAKAWAELIVPVTSDVKISWNAASKNTQEAIMRGTKWEKMLDNVREFISVRNQHALINNHYCRVTFQLTFLEENIEELNNIIELAIDLGVDRVKGHHLWAHFKEIQSSSLRRTPDSIARWNKVVKAAHKCAHKKILLENINSIELSTTASSSQKTTCPFLGKEAWVAHDGRFNPCCAPDEERKSLGDFGNLHETTIKNIWDSEAYQLLQKNYQEMPVCQRCNMRK